jgi:hypothetical protein
MAVIKVKPWGKGQGDHVLIDDFLFDPAKHELYEPEKPNQKPVADIPPTKVIPEVTATPDTKKRGRPAKGQD